MTERLYYTEKTECEAKVLSLRNAERGYEVLLDRTVIFPEGGGQLSDTGFIGEARVLHASEDGDDIWHLTDKPVDEGRTVRVAVDTQERFDHSQQHTGEHILSGLAKKMYGALNVGFHMAKDYVTIDLDKALTQEELEELEREANRAVQKCIPVTSRIVSEEELSSIPLRKRAEGLKGEIRIIEIADVDSCTCCGTHCLSSAQVGVVKITAFAKYKGGVRLWFACGMRAVEDYQKKQRITDALAKRFSVKTEDIPDSIERREQELNEVRRELKSRTAKVVEYTAKEALMKAESIGGIKLIIYQSEEFNQSELKLLSDNLISAGKCIALLFGTKGENIAYCIACSDGIKHSMRDICDAVNALLNGKGGGRPNFCQGSAPKKSGLDESLEQLENYMKSMLR